MIETPLKKVLIVDDDEIDLKKMGQIFEQKGVDVSYANNGKEAVLWLKKNGNHKLDAIISDVIMPEMNGIELSHHVGGAYPVILVSKEGELPFLSEEYLDLIQAYIDKSDLEHMLFSATIKAVQRFDDEISVAA
ncbi:MAG: hypothetical protein DRQ88_00530 [Epsilonproteobacteria bacterium]|nr:MAG: hypothetical protein DRQ89_03610 [Campylobacterota bacterium]RLA68121.1 MAG: hypothetical protein DRQ88_00530 [Campylobacterota bacterium]